MPSCRHSRCDGIKPATTRENTSCDGCDGMAECRHNPPETGSRRPESGCGGDAVTRAVEIGSLVVHYPAELPVLSPHAARLLLGILVELTDVPVLDRPGEEVRDDR
jgi:hypothetical protein